MVFRFFMASFALSSWTIARYDPSKLSQNLLENQSKSKSSKLIEIPDNNDSLYFIYCYAKKCITFVA